MDNVFLLMSKYINKILTSSFSIDNLENIVVEIPNNPQHGELSTNAALVVGKTIKKNPREVATLFLGDFRKLEFIKEVQIEGPGFINFRLKEQFWSGFLKDVLKSSKTYGLENIGNGKQINLEFVSVNPTGPLHIGHARGAIYGDAIANILSAMGYNITKEYYINDAGKQINTLIESLKIRYKNLSGANLSIPADCYPGEYLIDVASKAKEQFKADLDVVDQRELADFAVNEVMNLIKQDLADLGIRHDVFVSEYHDIIKESKIQIALEMLEEKGLIYQGILEAPKSVNEQDWEATQQTIFKSTNFGDDGDRTIIRSDGSYTYFVGDIAYHYYKLERGYNDMILLLGADHSGYVKRIKAIVSALSDNKATIDVKINQLVNLYKNGQPFKMSKRAGNFITVRDVLNEIGKDTFRFAILTKKNDTVLDIDFAALKEQNKDNPVWYVQYAHTRCQSVLKKAQELGSSNEELDYSYFPEDMNLIKMIALYPKILAAAASYHEPHRLNYYLQELANSFHQLWSGGNSNNKLRFINEQDKKLTQSRLVLVQIVANIISSGLKLLGIEPINEM
ncbi:MAG: arginine--tRNA ligase [Candidatus Midichloria mitochondrii]